VVEISTGVPGLIAAAITASMPFATWTQPLETASPMLDKVSVPWMCPSRASPPSRSVQVFECPFGAKIQSERFRSGPGGVRASPPAGGT